LTSRHRNHHIGIHHQRHLILRRKHESSSPAGHCDLPLRCSPHGRFLQPKPPSRGGCRISCSITTVGSIPSSSLRFFIIFKRPALCMVRTGLGSYTNAGSHPLRHSFRRYYLALLVLRFLYLFCVSFLVLSLPAHSAAYAYVLFSTEATITYRGATCKRGRCAVFSWSRDASKGDGMRGIRYFTVAHWLQQQTRCFDTVVRYHEQISNRVNELRPLST
jgi:hypothetical protein